MCGCFFLSYVLSCIQTDTGLLAGRHTGTALISSLYIIVPENRHKIHSHIARMRFCARFSDTHTKTYTLSLCKHTGNFKTKSIQSAFIPRSLDNEPLRMRYSGSCGSPRLRHELPCNQHTTSALIVKSFRGINARSTVTFCSEVNATSKRKNPCSFRK